MPQKQNYISAKAKENRVLIHISDNRTGIEKEIEYKIFLPFFTTRKEGAWTGLTLSKNIIESHGGYLAYQNDNSKTTFIICLVMKWNHLKTSPTLFGYTNKNNTFNKPIFL